MNAALPWQLSFQVAATPMMEGIVEFHNTTMLFLTFVGSLTCWLIFSCVQLYNDKVHNIPESFTHSTPLEMFWTIVPAMILVFIAIPSFALLYSMDDVNNPTITLKCVGHQWYWSYEYSDYSTFENGESINYDSYMFNVEEQEEGSLRRDGLFRLLEVDNDISLPMNNHIRVLVTAADVLHSWAVPSFGIKVDACPGRLNQGSLYLTQKGSYFGQCSEMCGVNHGFMPMVVEAVDMDSYITFIKSKIEDLEIDF